MTTTIADALSAARQRLDHALSSAGRDTNSATLLAVSKTKPADMVREAWQHGQREFGENYVQEALDKQQQLSDLDDIVWHFIGPLQSNKTREVANHFHWVHSVEREKIARRLSDQRDPALGALQVCLQVNISGEPSKSGVSLDELPKLAEQVASLPHIELRGLMAIPAPCDDPQRQREPFAALNDALKHLHSILPDAQLDTLSMGMSNDLEAAVFEGATMVRLGTAIFGARH
ncbi:YggS family pyridoxal phosphate-dependent enzyme [Halomonas cupida]|uniref:YggS family pyridoxal phosphate-dependent enzyme n=1 Tax=Halomonas cupida TaxID=44933 RepID=UPI003A93F6E5